jgi:hypothetical protein
MNCPVCFANSGQIATTIDGTGIICPTCGEYDVSNSVLAAEEWQRLYPVERSYVLEEAKRAKRSAQPATRQMITNDLLATYMQAGEQSVAV